MSRESAVHAIGGGSKAERYGWSVSDRPGDFGWVKKEMINVDPEYQRDVVVSKVAIITRNWSWIACGVLIVARRPDGSLWVIDGSNRLSAAKRRSDIDLMPCMIFDCVEKRLEARGFVGANRNRRPMSAISEFKAATVAQEEVAMAIHRVLGEFGFEIGKSKAANTNEIAAVGCLKRIVVDDGEGALREILSAAKEICTGHPIVEPILAGLRIIRRRVRGGLSRKLIDRMRDIGPVELEKKGREMCVLAGQGSANNRAKGMIEIVNKRLTNKFEFLPSNESNSE